MIERLDRTYEHIRTINSFVELGQQAMSSYKNLRQWQFNRTLWQLSIDPRDNMYRLATRWIAEQMDADAQHRLGVSMRYRNDRPPTAVAEFDPASGPVIIHVGGHRVRVTTSDSQASMRGGRGSDSIAAGMASVLHPSLLLQATSPAARLAVLRALDTLAASDGEQPGMFYADKWDGWTRRSLSPRSISTVILKDDLAARTLADMKKFLSAESAYQTMGIPWHRGYLFHGPPGTGKTSLVTALGYELQLNVYFLSLSGMKADADLASKLGSVPPRSILLLEDVDVYEAATTREGKTESPTMSGLLNALDGLVTPHGLITVLTTNSIESIDPAILRPGRADFVAHMDLPDRDQAISVVARFCPEVLGLPEFTPGSDLLPDVSTAAIVGIIKEHMDLPREDLARALSERVFTS